MASFGDGEEALRSTNQKSKFQRLTRLLMCGGAVLLRETFDSIVSTANLPTTLSDLSVESQLRAELFVLSPGVYSKSSDFDISLIFKLLRTICNLTPPPTGWDILTIDSDHSLEADLTRIKYYRNEVHGHSKTLEIPDDRFIDLWGKISEALLRIAANFSLEKRSIWKDAIEKFLHDSLTPEEERHVEELALWYEKDLDLIKELQELIPKVIHEEGRGLRQELSQEIGEIQEDVKGLSQQVRGQF